VLVLKKTITKSVKSITKKFLIRATEGRGAAINGRTLFCFLVGFDFVFYNAFLKAAIENKRSHIHLRYGWHHGRFHAVSSTVVDAFRATPCNCL
jgi:hypothetical protein